MAAEDDDLLFEWLQAAGLEHYHKSFVVRCDVV
jgi:hypothetical protein